MGYCGKGLQSGLTINVVGKGTVSMTGTPAVCEINWKECPDYLKYTQVIKPDLIPIITKEQPVDKPAKKKKSKNGAG